MLTAPLPVFSILGNSSPGPTRTQLEIRKDREISTRVGSKQGQTQRDFSPWKTSQTWTNCPFQHSYPGESIGLKFIPSQSELFRFLPIPVSEPMRIIPNRSEKRFVLHLMKNGQKSIRLNPINFETSIRMNPKLNHSILLKMSFTKSV